MLIYRILADAVVILHFSYVAFIVIGLLLIWVGRLLGWRWVANRTFRVLHLLAIGLVVVQAWLGVDCPLTVLENACRRRAGEASYPGSFIAYWAHELIFCDAPPAFFIGLYTVFAIVVLATFFWVPVHRSGSKS